MRHYPNKIRIWISQWDVDVFTICKNTHDQQLLYLLRNKFYRIRMFYGNMVAFLVNVVKFQTVKTFFWFFSQNTRLLDFLFFSYLNVLSILKFTLAELCLKAFDSSKIETILPQIYDFFSSLHKTIAKTSEG